MELPKNVTQIGESDKNCKIYVEDYVVSYIRQLNQLARNKDMAVALYGTRKTEKDIAYLFVYGACKLDFLQREIKHLSQAQRQEIEKLRRKHFPEQEFLGYRLLNGEMVEGFHIFEQDICRYVSGYAQFYEKNESMLAYMLAARVEEASPEAVSLDKYDSVKKRQEERREEYLAPDGGGLKGGSKGSLTREKKIEAVSVPRASNASRQGLWKMRVATAAVFALLCLTGIAILWDEQSAEDLQAAANRALAELTEQKLPDMENPSGTENQSSTLIVDGGLTEAMQEENAGGSMTTPNAAATPGVPATPEAAPVVTSTPSPTAAATPTPTPVPTATPAPVPVSYTIQEGDTLIGISISRYGTDAKVQEICALNQISDPDDVKIGQEILLPVP